jgi:uncharacterized membrane protein YbjE (DUF340 family)
MTISIIAALLFGIFSGRYFFPHSAAGALDGLATVALCFLVFLVGVDIGGNRRIFEEVKRHGTMIILVPMSIILGTAAGGVITGAILHIPVNISLSIASGFGWYSLSGILLTNLHSAEVGAIAFMANIFRELLTVISIPFIARYFNHYSAIAPAGATSMDTTLPIISRYTRPEIVVVSFFNGVLLSSLVPVLVPFFYSL